MSDMTKHKSIQELQSERKNLEHTATDLENKVAFWHTSENFIVDNVHGLDVIRNADAEDEYYPCDAEIKQVLRSRLMPEIPFPSCR
jgi:hypothetical protein